MLQATYEGVAAMQRRVAGTSHAAMGIVASIVGAPSTQVRPDTGVAQVLLEGVGVPQRQVAGTRVAIIWGFMASSAGGAPSTQVRPDTGVAQVLLEGVGVPQRQVAGTRVATIWGFMASSAGGAPWQAPCRGSARTSMKNATGACTAKPFPHLLLRISTNRALHVCAPLHNQA